MRHKHPIPWIHRWSRPIMAGVATLGAVITAYLTIAKLTENPTICPTKGCDTVLSSPYATVLGLPLALFGFLAYVSMIFLAIAPLLVKSSRSLLLSAESTSVLKPRSNRLESWTGLLLFIGATAMLVFSGYLMYLLIFEIKAVCIYCVVSALCSASLFVLSIIGRDWQDVGLLYIGMIVIMVVGVGTLGVYTTTKNPAISNSEQAGLEITTTSGEAEIALAKHLTQSGAKFYGSFWCPHCHEQKQLFGKEAMQYIPYVECSPPDRQGQTPTCQQQKIESYPTWEINGQRMTGVKSLEKLSKLSGYQGPRNFKNSLSPSHEG